MLVNKAFTPRRIGEMEERIRRLAHELVDAFEGPSIDFVHDYANPLPTIVIANLLGIPAEDQAMFKRQSNALVTPPPPGEEPDGGPALELAAYFLKIYEQRRKQPRDDLMSALLAAEIDGERLNDIELTAFAILLLVAGNETTTNLIGNGLALLERYPDQQGWLREHPDGLRNAIEEFLRFESPIPGIGRTAMRDVEHHGQRIEAGKKVMLLFGSGNRDERHFDDPDRFDLTRKPKQHLAFGLGTHFCLGSNLARLEARIAFDVLLERLPEWKLPGGEQRNPGGIRGYRSLPADIALV